MPFDRNPALSLENRKRLPRFVSWRTMMETAGENAWNAAMSFLSGEAT